MYKFGKNQRKSKDFLGILGYATIVAMVFQLLIPGLFGFGAAVGINTASAQEAATTTLTVTKVVDGGDAVVADFDLFVTDNATGTTTEVISGEENTFEVGTFTVSETTLAGYTATFSGDCDASGEVTLTEGVAAECTITNTFEEPATATTSLTVTKIVDGGDLVVEDFELFVNDSPVTSGEPLVFASTSIPSSPVTVSETEVAGYTATFSGDCDASGEVTIVEGEELECVITNTFEEPAATTTSLTVTKVVEGSDMVAGDFELFVNDTAVTSGEPLVFASTSIPSSPVVVSETAVEGFTATFSGDCDVNGEVTIVEGEQLECVITNTFATTTATTTSLTVTKVVEGGDLDVEDFPLFVNGVSITSGVATTTLATGTHAITETNADGYTATFGGDCDANGEITLAEGDQLECVITNTFDEEPAATTTEDQNININVTSSGGSSSATGGDVTVILGATSTQPTFIPFTFPGQILGAQSFVPVPFAGQVLGAQSAVPGLPTTGGDKSMSYGALMAFAGMLGVIGAGLILVPRHSSSKVSNRTQEK